MHQRLSGTFSVLLLFPSHLPPTAMQAGHSLILSFLSPSICHSSQIWTICCISYTHRTVLLLEASATTKNCNQTLSIVLILQLDAAYFSFDYLCSLHYFCQSHLSHTRKPFSSSWLVRIQVIMLKKKSIVDEYEDAKMESILNSWYGKPWSDISTMVQTREYREE